MKSFAAIISLLILGSGSAFHAPVVATSRVSSLRSEPNDDSSSSTGTQDSPDAQREALERQFKQNSKDVGVKNADGSFGTPKGGYSIGEDGNCVDKRAESGWGGGGENVWRIGFDLSSGVMVQLSCSCQSFHPRLTLFPSQTPQPFPSSPNLRTSMEVSLVMLVSTPSVSVAVTRHPCPS